MIRVCLTLVLGVITGCDRAMAPQDAASTTTSTLDPKPPTRAAVLSNIPRNSDKRCVGITVVAEALLNEVRSEGTARGEVEIVAQRMYDNLTTGRHLRYPPTVMIDGMRVPITSEEAIDRLSTLVAKKYKRDYSRLLETEEGRQKLLAAGNSFVTTSCALDRILEADPDTMDAFFGSGSRLFPDGSVQDTHHAFLIGKTSNGDTVVYDANDPGLPITCQLLNTHEGVAVEWTCRYRDTGHITTQRYLVVHKDQFFQLMLGR